MNPPRSLTLWSRYVVHWSLVVANIYLLCQRMHTHAIHVHVQVTRIYRQGRTMCTLTEGKEN